MKYRVTVHDFAGNAHQFVGVDARVASTGDTPPGYLVVVVEKKNRAVFRDGAWAWYEREELGDE